MIHRVLGRTNLNVPVIGLGTWNVLDVKGTEVEQQRHQVVKAAIDSGANFFDSSPMYGEAERVLGEALCNDRKDAFVATKVWTGSGRFDGDEQIRKAMLFYGGIIDLYQIHNLSEWKEVLPKLERLKEEGSVKSIGITHYRHSAFVEMMAIMRSGRVDAIQIPYNAGDIEAAKHIIPLAEELNIGVVVMQPLGTGTLTRMNPDDQSLTPFRSFGCETWAQVLLKWVISDPRVHVAIPATSSVEHMLANASAGEEPLMDEEHRSLVEKLVKQGWKRTAA